MSPIMPRLFRVHQSLTRDHDPYTRTRSRAGAHAYPRVRSDQEIEGVPFHKLTSRALRATASAERGSEFVRVKMIRCGA